SIVAISRLPGFVASQISEEPCCICLENLSPGQRACVLECAHLFHERCIQHWLRVQAACPLCK
ncbi:hypothetical protein T492DRAFT_555022, partial [Pavlovales sp. CCMP2436]